MTKIAAMQQFTVEFTWCPFCKTGTFKFLEFCGELRAFGKFHVQIFPITCFKNILIETRSGLICLFL